MATASCSRLRRFEFGRLAPCLLVVLTLGVPAAPAPAIGFGASADDGTCRRDDRTLCLLGGRFQVRVEWQSQRGRKGSGVGHAMEVGDRSGTFWFFQENNVELVVKALDGRRQNGNFWFSYGALTDVEYTLHVTDTVTQEERTYHNAPGNLCGDIDLTAFAVPPEDEAIAPPPLPSTGDDGALGDDSFEDRDPARKGETCQPDDHTLCLLGGRLEARVDWRNRRAGGTISHGGALPENDRTGFFWFFAEDNVELVVKALDGRRNNGRIWLFYGSLTDVEYVLTVTDTATGVVRSYHNPPGNLCGRGDTAAFCDKPEQCRPSSGAAARLFNAPPDDPLLGDLGTEAQTVGALILPESLPSP